MIVIKAPLLECYLDSSGAAEVKEIEKGTLIWCNPILHRHTNSQRHLCGDATSKLHVSLNEVSPEGTGGL
ncbi:MAG TPA: hypothetical protein VGL28_08250 [Steroidobacteraceae bacterium]